jgi:hypothetical protein
MNAILIFGGLAIVLFAASLFSKRRFGVLGLALAAGSILSGIWDGTAGLLVSLVNVVPKGSWTEAVTKVLVVLAPAIILLFHGVTYKTMPARILGSLLFTVLALTFLVEPLSTVLATDPLSKEVIGWLRANYSALISLGLILAVLDLFTTHAQAKHEQPKKGKH